MSYSAVSLYSALRGDNVAVVADQIGQLAEAAAFNGGALTKVRDAVQEAGALCVSIKGKKTAKYALADVGHTHLAKIEKSSSESPARDKGADMATRKAAALAFGQAAADAFRADYSARIGAIKADKAAKPAKAAAKAEASEREAVEMSTPPANDTIGTKESDRQRAARYLAELRKAHADIRALKAQLAGAAVAPAKRAPKVHTLPKAA